MVEVVGVDHVGIGTDQQPGNPGALLEYGNLNALVAALLQQGFTAEEAGKVIGGNYQRIFAKAMAGRTA